MPKPLAGNTLEFEPEADRFEDTRHPRETYELFGHAGAERELRLCFRQGRLPNAFIFGGPPGIGKATLAWRLARFLLANPDPARIRNNGGRGDLYVPPDAPAARLTAMLAHPDLFLLRREWDQEKKRHTTQIPVDGVRRAISLFQRGAGCGGFRICIVDCADDLSPASANALLKLVEEPPPRSLFLFVAHRPGRMLPTLRSRCRKIALHRLGAGDIDKVLSALGSPYSAGCTMREIAIARAQGSVQRALRLLDEEQLSVDTSLRQLLDGLPRIDWGKAHALADRIAARNNSKDYEAALAATEEWLDAKVRLGAQRYREDCARRLARYAEVWEKLIEAAREAEIFSLDKRPLVLSLIADLASAVQASPL